MPSPTSKRATIKDIGRFGGWAALILLLLTGCGPKARGITQLPATEVREYQGEKLSSVNDFRENSIAGPQKVALDTYKLEIMGLVDKPLSLTYDQVLASPHHSKVITLYCVEAGMPRSCGRAS